MYKRHYHWWDDKILCLKKVKCSGEHKKHSLLQYKSTGYVHSKTPIPSVTY